VTIEDVLLGCDAVVIQTAHHVIFILLLLMVVVVGESGIRHLFWWCLDLHLHVLLIRTWFLALPVDNGASLVGLGLFRSWRHVSFGFLEIFVASERVILLFLLVKLMLLLLLLLLLVLECFALHLVDYNTIGYVSRRLGLLCLMMLNLEVMLCLGLRLASLFGCYFV